MFGIDKKLKVITIEECKYCSSENISHLQASSGFGGGGGDVYVHNSCFSRVYFCKDCGKITDGTQGVS